MNKIAKRQHAVDSTVRTDAGAALSRLVVTVFRLDGALTAAGDRLAVPAAQTAARWRVLAAVEEQPATVAEIARAWSLARQSVQRVADALERDGLIAYETNPRHRRAQLVVLLPAGQRALAEIQAAQTAWANELGAQLGERAARTADETLTRLLELLVPR